MNRCVYCIGSDQVDAGKKWPSRKLDMKNDITFMEATSSVVAFVKEKRVMYLSLPNFQLSYISDKHIKSLRVSSQYVISIRVDSSIEVLKFNMESENVRAYSLCDVLDRALLADQLEFFHNYSICRVFCFFSQYRGHTISKQGGNSPLGLLFRNGPRGVPAGKPNGSLCFRLLLPGQGGLNCERRSGRQGTEVHRHEARRISSLLSSFVAGSRSRAYGSSKGNVDSVLPVARRRLCILPFCPVGRLKRCSNRAHYEAFPPS